MSGYYAGFLNSFFAEACGMEEEIVEEEEEEGEEEEEIMMMMNDCGEYSEFADVPSYEFQFAAEDDSFCE